MKKLITIFSLIFFSSFLSVAQVSNNSYQVSKQDIYNGYITEKIWLQNYELPKVQILQTQYEPSLLPADATAKKADDFEMILGKERKRPFIFIRIPAYAINEQTKQPQQLSSFNLQIEEVAAVPIQAPQTKTTANNSVLATGNWYKMAINARGIYKIDYNFIQDKLGINPSSINTANIRVYGNGGVMLSENNAIARPDDLTENSIAIIDGGDNSFDQNDYILFYANGPTAWIKDDVNKTFYHQKNLYEDKSFYFINFDQGAGQRITSQQSLPSGNMTVTSFDDYMVHDEDLVNVGKFGKKWWGEAFAPQSSKTFDFNVGNLTDSATIRFEIGSRAVSNGNIFSVSLNGQLLNTYNLGGVATGDDYAATVANASFKLPLNNTTASIKLDYSPSFSSGVGYLNYIEIITRRQLALTGGEVSFRDLKSVASGNSATFQIQNCNSNTIVWDVTDALHPVRINGTLTGSNYSFTQDASALHEYIAFDGSQYHTPEFREKVDNQNLHGNGQVDFLIVTHPDFLTATNKLADFHRQHDNMRVLVATTQQVYNEFSSGSQDISAIRDFARMFYKRATDTTQMPRYLLLFGDASYDYKNRLSTNSNFVPTYETSQSEIVINGYCSDDFFSFLDDNENAENPGIANTMDISIGRIPVNTTTAANNVVEKIINYKNPSSLGPWRLSTTIMTDYRDNEIIHFIDGELMGNVINAHSNLYNETKIHLAAITFVSTPAGVRSPDANKAINDQVYKGTFLMNYNGHGNITTLSSNRILTQDDFNQWKNLDKLPIMITATCEFSKYDDPSYVSAGEQLMMKPDGGAIALLTTTQLVFQGENQVMNKAYLNAQFQQYNGKWPTLGDALRYSKNETYIIPGLFDNFRKFVLLGDPALTPSFPEHAVHTESVIDANTNRPADTIKALGIYKINGSVKNTSGQLLNDFNGRVYVTIYDKPKTLQTIVTPVKNFSVQNNIVYKGKATVTNGLFSITFIAPKDLNYDFGKGKISYYAENGETDGAGADTNMTIGGFSDVIIADNESPVIKPFMNDSLFKDGGITGSNSVLYAQLFDESGINVSGNGIGHDITAVLDDKVGEPFILNDYYETAPNDYKKGFVFFPLTGLSEGKHSLRIKAWDAYNNSGEGVVNFEVINGNVFSIQNLMNYPNPFTDKTHFVFEHNHPEEKMNAEINIFSTSGYSVRTIKQTFTPEGSRSNEIIWDATDNNGAKLPAGIYVYRLNLTTEKGIKATAYQKLVLIR